MSRSVWHIPQVRNGARKYGITILGVVIALALIATVAGLYFMNAAATGPSAAESRIQTWVSQLGDAQLTPARHLAQQNLEEAGKSSVDPLIAALHSSNSALRRNSAEMLGFIASPQALDSLTSVMANDPVPSVRSRAAWALGELHDVRAVAALELASVLDQDDKVRQEASGSLDALRVHFAQSAGKNERIATSFSVAPGQTQVMYLAEMNQVSVSRDGGNTWSLTGSSLPSRVSALAVSPTNNNILYAGTESMGLYESTDGGTTWRARNQDIGLVPGVRLTITAIAIDRQSPDHIFVATGAWIGAEQAKLTTLEVMSSLNSGNTWQKSNMLAASAQVTRLVIYANTLYVLADDQVSSFPL